MAVVAAVPLLAQLLGITLLGGTIIYLTAQSTDRRQILLDWLQRVQFSPMGLRLQDRQELGNLSAALLNLPAAEVVATEQGSSQAAVQSEVSFALQELARLAAGEQLLVASGDIPLRGGPFDSLARLEEYRGLAISWASAGYITLAEFQKWEENVYPIELARLRSQGAVGGQTYRGVTYGGPGATYTITLPSGAVLPATPEADDFEEFVEWLVSMFAFHGSSLRIVLGAPAPAPAAPVPAPSVAVPAPAAAGAVTVNVPPLNVAALADGISQGLSLGLTGVLAGALALPLQNLSQRFHHDRNACLGSTGQLLQRLASTAAAAAPLVGGGFLLERMEDLLMPRIQGFLAESLDPARLPSPMTEGQVQDAATRLILDRVRFGVQAHLTAQAMELATPLKHLGVNQYSALLSDLAGFQRLATAMQGPVEFAAITQPMRYRANRLYRTTLPDINLAQFLYAKKEVLPSEFTDTMQALGYKDTFIRQLRGAAFLDPRLAEIVRIGQFFQPQIDPRLAQPTNDVVDWWSQRGEWVPQMGGMGRVLGPDWFFIYKMAKGGYEPTDVLVLTEVAKRATARREQTLALDSITRLYRDGFITDQEMNTRVHIAWALDPDPVTFANPISARIMATRWRAEAEDLADRRDLVLAAMSRGIIDDDVARVDLVQLGMRPEKVRMEVLKERLGLVRRVRLEIPEGEEGTLLQEVAGG